MSSVDEPHVELFAVRVHNPLGMGEGTEWPIFADYAPESPGFPDYTVLVRDEAMSVETARELAAALQGAIRALEEAQR